MSNIILNVFLVILCIILILSICMLIIVYFSQYCKLFFKIYLFLFEHEDYKIYKDVKNFLKNGGIIPVYSSYTNTRELNGYYFIVFDNKKVSFWKNNEPVFVEFHKFILKELIKLADAQERINFV